MVLELSPQAREALSKIGMALGLEVLKNLPASFDPEQLINKAGETLGREVRGAVEDALADPNSPLVQLLVDQLYENLDQSQLIEALAKPLAASLSDYLKQDGSSDLIDGIIQEMDLDNVGQIAGEKIAEQLSRK